MNEEVEEWNCNGIVEERVFIDVKVSQAKSSGLYVRCQELKNAIEKIEHNGHFTVVGIVYDGTNTIELLLDPPVGDDEE